MRILIEVPNLEVLWNTSIESLVVMIKEYL